MIKPPSEYTILILILIADVLSSLSGTILALYLHKQDQAKSAEDHDEEVDTLNDIVDALYLPEDENDSDHID